MTGPSPSISKKKTKSKAAKQASCSDSMKEQLEISPASVKATFSEHATDVKPKTIPGAQGARRSLNFANINLSNLSSSSAQVFTLGGLKRSTKEWLQKNDAGKIDVTLHVSPIRLPKAWNKFKFFLFADHTGVASFGALVEIFGVLEPYVTTDLSVTPPVTIEGTIHFKRSTTTTGEVYMTIRDGGAKITTTQAVQHPQTFSTFHTIRHIMANTYHSSATFYRLIGDCVKIQKSDDGKTSYMLQDSTEFAVLHVKHGNDVIESNDDLHDTGPKIFEGTFKFETIDIEGMPTISATVNANSIGIKRAYPFIERHITMVKTTRTEDYEFPIDSEFDIRAS